MKISKEDYYKILDSIKPNDLRKGGYKYYSAGNDPYSHNKFQPKSAKYEFYLIVGDKEIILESASFFKIDHKTKEQELIKKFGKWSKDWINEANK